MKDIITAKIWSINSAGPGAARLVLDLADGVQLLSRGGVNFHMLQFQPLFRN